MGNFNRGGRGGRPFGKKNYNNDRGGFRDHDRRNGGRADMHQATCSECGNPCEVPFKPTGARPIFCNNCFGKQKNQEGRKFNGGSRERNFDRPRFENKRPEFRQAPVQDNQIINELKQQLEAMNNKLERILNLVMAPAETQKINTKEKVSEKPTEAAPKKAKTKKAVTKKKK